ncbi:MAG: beta-propeller domain-containing protein [Oscillospiraceae bacterium]|nr:beta-propeller domain-containing protein [Oscillospiraceae bacterium]
MKKISCILALLVALTACTPAIVNYTSNIDTNVTPIPQSGDIISDGKAYQISQINAVQTEDDITEQSLPAVGSIEALLKLLNERGALYDESLNYQYDGIVREDSNAAAPVPSTEAAIGGEMAAMDTGAATAGGNHSATNEQVAGVNEGDIVKTDGKYIYTLSGDRLRIVRVEGSDMKEVAVITFENMWSAEFYLMGDKLAVVGQKYIPITPLVVENETEKIVADVAYGYTMGRNCTVLAVYDITDRANPVESRRVEMDGYGISTRVIGDTVYLVTNKYVWAPYVRADSDVILPGFRDTETGGEAFEPFDLDRVYYVPDSRDSSYLIIGALDVNGNEPFEPTAYLGAGNQVYMSLNALYVGTTRWEEAKDGKGGSEKTDILRFTISEESVKYSGMGTVAGMPINQYSMDEFNGFFRVATTQWEKGTMVTVLDGGMKIAGQTDYLAPGEWMQSMRFMGNMGYVVTFENVDPLFTVDLTDPYNPKVLGELKIPGFSQYLHPVGNGLLLGIGRDTTELYTKDKNGVETVVGFRDIGMKVSLFDVSDPYDPKEIDVLELGEGWAEVSHNPRALMSDPARGLYGFTTENWNEKNYGSSAVLIQVDGRRISVAANLNADGAYLYNSRLCYIGDTLYFVYNEGIRAYDYNTFRLIERLTF